VRDSPMCIGKGEPARCVLSTAGVILDKKRAAGGVMV
jgi:hypothetical protein